jgi:MFS family permease
LVCWPYLSPDYYLFNRPLYYLLIGLYSPIWLLEPFVFASQEPQVAAAEYLTSGFFVSQFVGTILALTLLIFGVVALFAYLANRSGRALALAAMVLSIVGIALGLSGSGSVAYALPALSEAYLGGQEETAITVAASIIAGPWGTISTAFFLLYSAGFILFGVAIWRSGVLPGWAGVLVAVHAPLISGPFGQVGSVVGALLAVVGGGWIALSILRSPSAPREADAEPRVR